MHRPYIQIFVAILALIHVPPTFACIVPPAEITLHHAELVANSKNIVLARVIGGSEKVNFGWFGERQRAEFEVVEVLRGDVEKTFTLDNGILGHDDERERDVGDFRGHRDAVFWDKHTTRQWNMPDCTMRPVFFKGQTYLIFVDHPHWRAYEEIRSNDDLWLSAVRRLIGDPSLTSGVSMSMQEWLSLSRSVFIGQIEACDGPILSVTKTLHGETDESWRYSDDESYWPNRQCGVGGEYFVITYYPEPAILPYYSSSMFRIRDGLVDLGDAIDDSEIDVQAETVQQVDKLELLFEPKGVP